MTKTFNFILCIVVLLFLWSCNSTRKTIKSETQSLSSTHTTIDNNSSFNQTGEISTQANFSEALKGTYEFTRVEFSDGTTIEDIHPSNANERAYEVLSKRTEPPDSKENKLPGINAITTGRLNFNKKTQEHTNSQTQKETNLQNSINIQQDKTSVITNQENSYEKEKHGFIYYVEIIIITGLGGFIIYYLIKGINLILKKV